MKFVPKNTNYATDILKQRELENKSTHYEAFTKELIFSGDNYDYPIYVYVKDSELITVSKYVFMEEATDTVDVKFRSAVGDSSGNKELEVRKPAFDESENFLKISDWEYDNLKDPIIVTFAEDMSSIDVSATWNMKVTDEQYIYDGRYELEGIYNVEEFKNKFYSEDGFKVPYSEEGESTVSLPKDMKIGDSQLESFEISGRYDSDDNSEICLSMYSDLEEKYVGNVEISLNAKKDSYTGELIEEAKNVYRVENTEADILLGFSLNDDGKICLQLFINREFEEEFLMVEHFES